MIRIRTPLVIGTILVVVILGVARLALMPDSWATSLVALAFFPIVFGVLTIRPPSNSDPEKTKQLAGKLRVGIVAAGVVLASSLLLSITDFIGLTAESGDAGGRSLLVMLGAVIASVAEVISSRLEKKAGKDAD